MLKRKYVFPHVIELNYQAGRRLGVNIYLIDGGSEFVIIDVGYLETFPDVVDLIRQMDFNLSNCKMSLRLMPTPTISRPSARRGKCSRRR